MTTTPTTIESMRPGAGVAVHTCMNVQPGERVLVLTDNATAVIGQALALEALDAGAVVQLHYLEAFSPRPILELPDGIVDSYRQFQPQVSFFAASALPGEIAYRMKLGVILRTQFQLRHGHMPGVTPRLMQEGMMVDYNRIAALTHRVNAIVSVAKTMHITNPRGTDLTAEFSPELKWVPCHGLYHQPGGWGNLPEGETYTSPANLNGVLVADVLGDYFSEKYGLLEHPVRFTVANGWVTEVACEDQNLAAEVLAYLDSAENGRRAGEFAVGTNIALTQAVGNLLQDEKIPGIHVAFGNPYPHETGANWASTVHVDAIPLQCTIDVDGRRLMTAGVFAPDILADPS